MMAGDQAIGALGIGVGQERQFSEDETQLLLAIGRILAQEPC
jgi:hypothetical protein